MRLSRRRLVAFALATPAIAGAEAAFPWRPISWLIPSPPGSVLDIGARLLSQKMSEVLGQPVVVETRPGAGGVIAAEACLRAPADGHTMFFGNFATFAIAPLLLPRIPYDAERDFRPVQGIGASFNVLVCGAGQPYGTLPELIAHARANPEKVTFAAGTGSGPHAAALLFAQASGTRLTHVPYANFSQMLNDVATGRVDLVFEYPLSALPQVRDGKLRALAVNAPARLTVVPDVPTLGELGVTGAELYGWSGIYVPAAVPDGAVAQLAAAAVAALGIPEVRRLFDASGTVPWAEMDAVRMRTQLAAEIPRMRRLLGGIVAAP